MAAYFASITNFTAPWHNLKSGDEAELLRWVQQWTGAHIKVEIRDADNRENILFHGFSEDAKKWITERSDAK